MGSKVSIVKCADYKKENVDFAVKKALALVGGIPDFIKPGARVLLKPNLLMSIEPERAITTHPEVVRPVIRILKDIGVKVYIADTPSVWGKKEDIEIKELYKKTGMASIAKEEGAELITLKQKSFKKGLPLASFIDEVDAVINIAKFKTHGLMILTAAVKNLFGLIPGLFKSELHKKYFKAREFAAMLLDVYESVSPALTIVDAVDIIEGDGPATSGEKRHVGLILAGRDAIAIDSVLAKIMNLTPEDIPVIAASGRRNLGCSDLRSIEILGENLNDVILADFKLPNPAMIYKIPKPAFEIFKKLLDYRPEIDPTVCVKCNRCRQICPEKVITLEPKIKIDYSRCIRCFCCQEACPERAISTRKSFLAKILGMRG